MANYWALTLRRLLMLGLLPIMAGSVIGWRAWIWKADTAGFVENLRQVEGRILRMENLDGGLQLYVAYLDEAGVRFEKPLQVSPADEAELRNSEKISIVYDQRDPRVAEAGDIVSVSREMTVATTSMMAGLALLLGGTIVIAHRARHVTRIERLFRLGQNIETEVRDSKLSPGRRVGRFTYAFRGPHGRWYEGKSPELPVESLAAWPSGRRIRVAYDPNNPRDTEPDIFGLLPN